MKARDFRKRLLADKEMKEKFLAIIANTDASDREMIKKEILKYADACFRKHHDII